MKLLIRGGSLALGTVCLFFGLLPMVCYGHFHVGLWALVLAGAGFLLWPALWDRFPRGRFWRLIRELGRVCLLLFLVLQLVLSPLMAYYALGNRPPPEETGLTVVVLGCLAVGDSPSLMLQYRLEAALDFVRQHPDADIPVVVSGGRGPGEEYAEADVMYRWLAARGLDPDRIYREGASADTRENLRFSADLIRRQGLPGSVVIISDGFHLMRGALYAGRFGLDPAYTAAGRTPWGLLPGYWVREQLAILWALILD